MKLFFRYLRGHRRIVLLQVSFFLVFVVSFWLYHLPLAAVVYPTLLCICGGVTALVLDYLRVKKEHEKLKRLQDFTDVWTDAFPKTAAILEEDYQEIIRLLSEEHQIFRIETDRKYADMVDYYTVWAHQIKTPIAAMKLHLQNEDSAFSRKLISDLLRIEQYVEMVLTFLRLDTEGTDYVIREYDLDTIVKQAVKKFSSEFIGRRLKLIYEPLEASVITDEKWLSFVVEQVLSNALKYTTEGSISISLKSEMKLEIQDTGIGIASEDLPRVFENGFTGYNGRLDKKASGIGLYLCRRICNNLGHTISVHSVVGQGTVIQIDLARKPLQAE